MNPDQQIDLYRQARSIAWSYRLQEYDAAALKDLQRIVEKSKGSIVQKFADGLGQEGAYTRQHYQNSLKELNRLSLGLQAQLGEQLTTSTSRIGSLALKEWGENLSVGGVAKKVNTVALSPEQFKVFFKRNPPEGILIPKVMRNAVNQGVTARIQGELLDVLREGALTGQSYKRIVDRLEESFTDFSRHQLTTLTRTFFQTANAQAFDAVYQANADIIEGKIWTNVNDDRVCLLCLPLGEVLYKKGEDHPPMPRHPNCRCVFRAKTVSFRELGMDIDELEEVTAPVVTRGYEKNGKWIVPPAGTGTGRGPRAVSFYKGGMKEAFPDMPEAMQKRMLGVSRYNMYRAGELTLDQMVDPVSGKLWLLKEIEQGMHKAGAGSKLAEVVITPPVSRPVVSEVEQKWQAIQSSDEFKNLEQKKLAADEAFKKAEEAFKAGPGPGFNMSAEDKALRTKLGNNVYTAKQLRMQLANELNQYQYEKFNVLIRPTTTGTLKADISSSLIKTKAAKANFESLKHAAAQMLHKNVVNNVRTVDLMVKKGSRAYYRESSRVVNMPSLTKKDTFVHEFGHAIEHNIPGVKKAALDFRTRRTIGEDLKPIFKGRDELGWKDEFFDHYCGKYYSHGSTEIISMGLEKMYKDPIGFLKRDPEYFELILKVMWGDL